ncbi:MAG TPA: serine hydrolase [Acidobacteriota bacterium]|jgi:beta-lactamase class A
MELNNSATMTEAGSDRLRTKIEEIGSGCELGIAFFDYQTQSKWSYQGDRWFHAASTIKAAVLLALFKAIEEGRFSLDSRLHVRNRFLSAVDGEPYRISADRDADSKVHSALGKTMRLGDLALQMIVTSSNLATNLLVDLIGIREAQQSISALGCPGIELLRGVEDRKAFDTNIINRVTAEGLLELFRAIYEQRNLSSESAQRMLEILNQQEFNSGIPAGLPTSIREQCRVAHKTGDISRVAHDAGLVFLPNRKPYALAILTEAGAENSTKQEKVARISEVIYQHLISDGE